jgi:hypothetical protein
LAVRPVLDPELPELEPPELRALPELLDPLLPSLPLERVLLGRELEPVLRLLPERV